MRDTPTMKAVRTQILRATPLVGAVALSSSATTQAADKTNIVFILTGNLGCGEFGCCGGGGGLARRKVTLGEALSDAGDANDRCGKWRLGSREGRLAHNHEFDAWHGIRRTTDETRWPSSPGWSPAIMSAELSTEGKKGEQRRELPIDDVHERGLMGAEITQRSVGFIEREAKFAKPFFAYVALAQPHLPTEPNPSFAGNTSSSDWADMLAEMAASVDQILDAVDKVGARDNTISIFTSDIGPEFFSPWDGWAGPWREPYFTAWQGGIGVPFLIRWPGKIAAVRVSHEMAHGVDRFATLAKFDGTHGPAERPMDRLNQSDFLLGKTESSPRAGFPIIGAERLRAVKWRHWKRQSMRQHHLFDKQVKRPAPTIHSLYTDPREEKPTADPWGRGSDSENRGRVPCTHEKQSAHLNGHT